MNFFLDSIVNSIGLIIENYAIPEDNRQYSPSHVNSVNHTIAMELLKKFINRFPSLIIYIIDYKISNETIDKYFQSLPSLYGLLQQKLDKNNKNISFIDFIFISYPYNGSISLQILILLLSENYFYKYVEVNGEKLLCNSAIFWRYEIFDKLLEEYKKIIEENNYSKDLMDFLKIHHLQILLINIFIKSKNFIHKFVNFDIAFCKEIYELSLIVLKEFTKSNNLTVIKRNGVEYSLLQKCHNRIIKLSIFRKKNTEFQKKDMCYFK